MKKPFRKLFLVFCLFISTKIVLAQHEHHAEADTMKTQTHGMEMSSSFSPNLSMSRDGSGTSWQPDANPMFMYMKMFGKDSHGMTSLMVHGSIFLRYTAQDITKQGDRGDEKWDAPNMFMLLLSHRHTKDVFSLLTMFSLDPVTEGGEGYPLLLQSGESFNGVPLVDRQHPHDLFAELAFNYTHAFSGDVDVNAYIGYPAEPALGPVVFMHRLSAMHNPDAPLGHHWQDATHITFGVGTLGVRYKIVKAEGSIFTGREPDDSRYDFDKARFDSYSYRININPDKNFALQFSQGFIESPEQLEPETDIIRTTASVIHTVQLDSKRFISSSIVWGQNHSSEGETLPSLLVESNLQLSPLTIYARYEFIQKDAHELQLQLFDGSSPFNIRALTMGFNKTILNRLKTDLSIGIQGTINFPDDRLKPVYGDHPLGAEIYLKISPQMHEGH